MADIKTLNGYTLADTKARQDIATLTEEIEQLKGETEIITRTGVIVNIDADAGAALKIEANTAETVSLYHTGKNMMPCNLYVAASNGMTITQTDDGKVQFSGTPTKTTYADVVVAADKFYLPAGNYTIHAFNFPTIGTAAPVTFSVETVDGSTPFDGENGITVHGLNSGRQFTLSAGAFVKAYYKILTSFSGAKTTCSVMIGMNLTSASKWEAPTATHVDTQFPATMTAYDGTNILYTNKGNTLTVSVAVSKKDAVDEDAVNSLIAEAMKFDATQYGIPVLTLDGDCTGMTKDDYVALAFTFRDKDGNPLSGNADVKKQGSSSIQTGIEIGKDFDTDLGGLFNFTIKFPTAFEAKAGWTAQKKYCVKVNAIDHSHARNVCSCKLWGEIVKARPNVPAELSSLINGGAIDGFPIVIVLNGKFYALGTFNIPKEGWMFGSPKAILCADDHVDSTKFKALATLDGDFELEYVEDENNAGWVLTSLNRAIQAVMDGDLDTAAQYIDIPSAIDYYIHTVDENADDGTDKNYILVTFDGVKWYFSAYDRDTVYGLYWNGKSFTSPRGGITYAHYATVHRLMELIYTHKKADLKARAKALRDGIKSEINVCNVFTNFAAGIPAELLAQNCRRWPLLRSTNASNTAQILNWYRLRRQIIDKEIDGWTV